MQQNHRHRHKRLSGTAIVVVLVCAALLYAGLLLGVQTIGNRLERRDAVESIGSLEGRFTSDALTMQYGGRTWTYRERELTNLLLIGVDWEKSENTVSGHYAGQADFLFLITIDRENKIVSTLQLDRDTMADIRVYGPLGDYTGIQKMQICLSHAYGKSDVQNCENTVWAVSRLLGGIPIDGYITLDISGITALNDALGGVTVTLEEDFSALDPEMTKGATLTLHGIPERQQQIIQTENAKDKHQYRDRVDRSEKIVIACFSIHTKGKLEDIRQYQIAKTNYSADRGDLPIKCFLISQMPEHFRKQVAEHWEDDPVQKREVRLCIVISPEVSCKLIDVHISCDRPFQQSAHDGCCCRNHKQCAVLPSQLLRQRKKQECKTRKLQNIYSEQEGEGIQIQLFSR